MSFVLVDFNRRTDDVVSDAGGLCEQGMHNLCSGRRSCFHLLLSLDRIGPVPIGFRLRAGPFYRGKL